MEYLPTGKQMKKADEYTIQTKGISSLLLMERAADACVSKIELLGLDLKKISIVCGSGNNGGDGFAMARLLQERGFCTYAFLVGNPEHLTKECKLQIEMLEKIGGIVITADQIDVLSVLKDSSLIIDCIFGVGLSRLVSGFYKDVIRLINDSHVPVVSVDMPSGICADTGSVLGAAVKADYTICIQNRKFGLLIYPGKAYAGKVFVEDIGISQDIFTHDLTPITFNADEMRRMLPIRSRDSNKGSFGKLLVIAGSDGMAGAAYLNALAAYRCGCGLVRIYTPESNRIIMQTLLPEAVLTTYSSFEKEKLSELLTWADTVCIGSGLGQGKIAELIVKEVMRHIEKPLVVDADAINILSRHKDWINHSWSQIIYTPHLKELERLSDVPIDEIKNDRLKVLDEWNVSGQIIVCKDAVTVVHSKEQIYVNETGTSVLAKAGAGDVLCGMIGAFLATGVPAHMAASLAVYYHGLAGRVAGELNGERSALAGEIANAIGKAFLC